VEGLVFWIWALPITSCAWALQHAHPPHQPHQGHDCFCCFSRNPRKRDSDEIDIRNERMNCNRIWALPTTSCAWALQHAHPPHQPHQGHDCFCCFSRNPRKRDSDEIDIRNERMNCKRKPADSNVKAHVRGSSPKGLMILETGAGISIAVHTDVNPEYKSIQTAITHPVFQQRYLSYIACISTTPCTPLSAIVP
jgi:hypothetical protein